jgi:hypothetical protein
MGGVEREGEGEVKLDLSSYFSCFNKRVKLWKSRPASHRVLSVFDSSKPNTKQHHPKTPQRILAT